MWTFLLGWGVLEYPQYPPSLRACRTLKKQASCEVCLNNVKFICKLDGKMGDNANF